MQQTSRKQRERDNRHSLFLELAAKLIEDEGFPGLSMDRVAELAEYSKGTIYQHFSCREDLLVQLCNQSLSKLLELMKIAAGFDGHHRDCIVATVYAHTLWTRQSACNIDMLQHTAVASVTSKATENSLAQHKHIEQELMATLVELVQGAINNNELPKNKQLNPMDVVFGLWSTCYGGQLIINSDIELSELGVKNTHAVLLRTACLIMDGMQWQPLHSEKRLKKLLARFETELFANELNQLGIKTLFESQTK